MQDEKGVNKIHSRQISLAMSFSFILGIIQSCPKLFTCIAYNIIEETLLQLTVKIISEVIKFKPQ